MSLNANSPPRLREDSTSRGYLCDVHGRGATAPTIGRQRWEEAERDVIGDIMVMSEVCPVAHVHTLPCLTFIYRWCLIRGKHYRVPTQRNIYSPEVRHSSRRTVIQ